LDIPDVGAGKQPARPETGRQPDPARPLAAQVDRRTARGARRGSVDGGAERVERVVAADPRRPRGLRGPQGAKRLNRRDQALDPRADRWELEAERFVLAFEPAGAEAEDPAQLARELNATPG